MSQLHGVETYELSSGSVAVVTIQTAVIGLVGTAPDAEPGKIASVNTGTSILNNAITFAAKKPGLEGNKYSVTARATPLNTVDPASADTTATWRDNELTILLGIDVAGAVTATASEVAELINAMSDTEILATLPGTGAGIVIPFSEALTGGTDEPYPLNTPVAVIGTTQTGKLGTAGTLWQALQDINAQRNALTVVVRVEDDPDAVKQRANILAGIQALSKSKSVTSYQPRVLIATGFSEDDAVGKELETQANKLRAIAYVDCASMATLQDVVQRRQSFGGRTELIRYRPLAANTAGDLVYRAGSAFAAGLRARIDYENGWWWSKSNQEIYNVLGVEQVDEFILGEPNCDANLLNMQNISTMIRRGGFKHWGNRLCASDQQWKFEARRRAADVIEDSIQDAMLPYVDRPIDKENADDILGTINAYLRSLVKLRAIYGGLAWLDEELNTAETLEQGWLYINYDFGLKSPTELISLRVRVNNTYGLEELAA